MKKIIALFCLLAAVLSANAQFFNNHALYGTCEAGLGNYFEMNFNLNLVMNEKYSIMVGVSEHLRGARSKPEDYNSGALLIIFSAGFSEIIVDEILNYQALFGYVCSLNENSTVRLNLSGGLGYTVIKEPTNWVYVGGSLFENYTYDIEKHTTISLILNPKIEWPITRIFGLTFSPMVLINKDRTYVGIGFGSMIGLLRAKTQ